MHCSLQHILPGSFTHQLDLLLAFQFLNAALLAEGSNMPKRYDSSFCGDQLTRRGELHGLLQAGWSPPNVNAPGLPRAPSGAIGIPRTPTGKPILFAPVRRTQVLALLCHQMFFGVCLLQHLQVCYASIAPNLEIASCLLQNLDTPKSPSAVVSSLPALSHSPILTGWSVRA